MVLKPDLFNKKKKINRKSPFQPTQPLTTPPNLSCPAPHPTPNSDPTSASAPRLSLAVSSLSYSNRLFWHIEAGRIPMVVGLIISNPNLYLTEK